MTGLNGASDLVQNRVNIIKPRVEIRVIFPALHGSHWMCECWTQTRLQWDDRVALEAAVCHISQNNQVKRWCVSVVRLSFSAAVQHHLTHSKNSEFSVKPSQSSQFKTPLNLELMKANRRRQSFAFKTSPLRRERSWWGISATGD